MTNQSPAVTPEQCRELADEWERLLSEQSTKDFPARFAVLQRLEDLPVEHAPAIITALRGYADAVAECERLRRELDDAVKGLALADSMHSAAFDYAELDMLEDDCEEYNAVQHAMADYWNHRRKVRDE